jgi:predicted dehydrogenase
MDTRMPGSGMSRRDFVRSTAAVVGGAAALRNPLKASAFFTSDEVIRVGLVGCGGRGTGAAAQALTAHPSVRLVAMADAFADRIEECHRNLTDPAATDYTGFDTASIRDRVDVPPERRFTGFDAYEKVIPLADVVILTTPPGFRPIHFEAAVRAGKHVFMEKPVATDAPGIRRVLAAAEEAKAKKLNVVVGLQRRYDVQYRDWVERLHAGMIGDIILSRVYWDSAGVWVHDRATLEQEAGRKLTEMEYQMRNWYYFNWLCGDHICEQHIHNLDVGNWVKQGYPVRAQGKGGRQVRTGIDHGQIFDHFVIEYEYADGSRMVSSCRHQEGCWSAVTEGFHGTNGTAPAPGRILSASGHTLFQHRGKDDPNPYQVEHDELFDAIVNGEYRFSDAENGAYATMTAIMGRMAAYSGQMVEWEKALASEVDIMPARYAWDADPPVMPDENGRYPIPMPGLSQVI